MNNFIFQDASGAEYIRVNKTKARNAYISGGDVVLCPCKLRPFSMWHCEAKINRKMRAAFILDDIGVKNDFNNYVNSFEYYNCSLNECGKYTAFYLPLNQD